MQEVKEMEKENIREEDDASLLSEDVGIPVVYELGFLLTPSILEDSLTEVVFSIKSAIEEVEGTFISEGFPQLKPLSYSIYKSVDGKNEKYTQAYFGWIKFEVLPSKILDVKKIFKADGRFLRFLIIKTVRDNTLYSHKIAMLKKERQSKQSEGNQEKEAISSEEIDKSIEKLITE